MGQQKTTQETTIPGAGGQEAAMMQLLAQLAQRFGGQMGDLSQLAQGGVGGPSAEDYQLVNQTIGRTGEMAQREAERIMGPLMAQLTEQNTGRGVAGSSMDTLSRLLGGREISGRIADMLSQSQQQGGQALLNLPFQRAEAKIGANRTLFDMLSGAANPVMAGGLQSRLAQPKTTQTQPQDWGKIFQTAIALGGIPFTGGASAFALPGLTGGGGGAGGAGSSPPGLDWGRLGSYQQR